jgi:hypothetical protein
LKPGCHELLLTFAFKFHRRRYNKDTSKANNILKEVLAYNRGALQLVTCVASFRFQRVSASAPEIQITTR